MAVSCLLEVCFLDFYESWSSSSSLFFLSAAVGKRSDKGEFMMSRAGLLLGYFLVKVLALVCTAEGEPGQQLESVVMVSASNDSREVEGGLPETPHTEDRCRGYYDVMGQWDPPFVCRTASYLYCCGTCGFRFCCAYKSSRLDQSKCKNYDTPLWMMTGRPPSKKNDRTHDPTRDKTNLIVYIICGVVAVMALVGIFTKLGLEKAHRPHRENMTRALASVMQQQVPGSREHLEQEVIMGSQGQHYENMQACATPSSLQGPQMNNTGMSMGHNPSLVPTMGQNMNQNIGQNMNQTMGQNMAHAMGQNMTHAMGQNMAHSMGQNMGQNLAHSMGQNMAHTMGQNLGQNMVHGIGQNMAHTMGQNMSQSIAHSMGQNMAHNTGQNIGQNMAHTMGQNMGQSMAHNMAHTIGQSMAHNMAHNISQSMAHTMGQNMGQNMAHTMGQNMGQNMAHTMGQNMGQHMAHGIGQSMTHTIGQNMAHAMSQKMSQTMAHTIPQPMARTLGQTSLPHAIPQLMARPLGQTMTHTIPQPISRTLGHTMAHTLPQPMATHVSLPMTHTYHTLGQLSKTYEQPSAKDISSKYASLKAVAEKASDNYYTNRRQMVDFALKGSLPLQPVHLDHSSGSSAPYSTEMVGPKQNGHRAKASSRSHASHPLAYASNTISSPGLGMVRGWAASETLGRRQSYGAKRHYGLEQHKLRPAHSQHFTPQPYFITNSKTEVTV